MVAPVAADPPLLAVVPPSAFVHGVLVPPVGALRVLLVEMLMNAAKISVAFAVTVVIAPASTLVSAGLESVNAPTAWRGGVGGVAPDAGVAFTLPRKAKIRAMTRPPPVCVTNGAVSVGPASFQKKVA